MHLPIPMARFHLHLLTVFVLVISSSGGSAKGATFELENRCRHTVWPGIQPGAGHPILMNGGLELKPNETATIPAPAGWSGRFWGRAGCAFESTGKGTCLSGGCGGGLLECAGTGGAPPTTLAEFTLDGPLDFYDISLVDGYNMPVSIIPTTNNAGSGDPRCKSVGCVTDLNSICPAALQVVEGNTSTVVACKSACMAFDNKPEYCCTGSYNDPNTCKPTRFSRLFKASCPDAYSYAYDDATSTFTCRGVVLLKYYLSSTSRLSFFLS